MAKLVRDEVPTMAREAGRPMNVENAPSYSHWRWLLKKLVEEAEEVAEARSEYEILEELGDVYAVMQAMAKRINFSMDQIERRAIEKEHTHGGFSYFLIWDEKR